MVCSFSAGCSETWAWSGAPRSAAQPATAAMLAGSTARTEWTAAPMRTSGASAQRSGAGRPRVDVGVGEPALRRLELDVDAAVEVAGVEQRDADPGVAGGGDERLGHRVGFGVRRPPGA